MLCLLMLTYQLELIWFFDLEIALPKRSICRDLGSQQRYARFCGRLVVLSVLILLLYPFLWVWTVIGTLWFTSAKSCVSFFSLNALMQLLHQPQCVLYLLISAFLLLFQLPEEGQKWGFLIWLLFSYCGLVCIACMSAGKVCSDLWMLNWSCKLLPFSV